MSGIDDSKLHQILMAMQSKMIEDNRALTSTRAQFQAKDREKRLADMTLRELAPLPDSVRSYESVGKMFMLSDMPTMKKKLTDRSNEVTESMRVLEKKQIYLQKQMEETNANLRDIVHQSSSATTSS
ncbi:MAG: Prefoldin [Piptocephalis tieghemiana]|nr:MAG: Prefoldin [Piptocephalis tieghemiana]